MAKSDSTEGKEMKTIFKKPTFKLPEPIQEEIEADVEKEEVKLLRRRDDFQEAEGFKKMASMAIMANLFQASTGRAMEPAAKCACDAAEILWKEWIRRGVKK